MSEPTLLVLAAGIGSRYGGLKQIDPVGPNGEKIIDYCIYDALRAGFKKVVFVIRRDIEQDFRIAIGDRLERHIETQYAFQELANLPAPYRAPADRVKPWGTGHAVLAAKDVIHEPFGVVNADDFYGAEGFRLLYHFLSTAASAPVPHYALVAYLLRNTLSDHGSVARGICQCSADGYLEKVTERLKIERDGRGARDTETNTTFTGAEHVSMNMWGFTPDFFDVLNEGFARFLKISIAVPKSEYLLPEVVDGRIQTGDARVKALTTPDTWFGVTYPEDKPLVQKSIEAFIREGRYPTPLWRNP